MTKNCLLLLYLCLLASGCSDSSSTAAQWRDYNAALTRILDRSVPVSSAGKFPVFPPARSLTVDLPASQINLLEFLRLRQCQLSQVLAERNSILGKHGDASARLLFDLHFLSKVDACIDSLSSKGDRELIAQLRDARAQKKQYLPSVIFTALIAGPEFRRLWQRPQQDITYPRRHDDIAVAALSRWHALQSQWLALASGAEHPPTQWQVKDSDIYALLADIQLGLGGALLVFTEDSINGLSRSVALLRQRIDGRPLCLTGSPTAAARQFHGLLQGLFVNELQADASLANRHQYALHSAVVKIEEQLLGAMTERGQAVPEAYLRWRAAREQVLREHLSLQRRHVETAGRLLDQCGLHTAQSRS